GGAIAQTPSPTPANPVPQATPALPEPRPPNFPDVQQQPVPPLPDLTRIGVSGQMLTLSMNDAIRRALTNNNDIEVARDDVRVNEQRLRVLYGIYDPVFTMTPTFDQRISPVTSIFAGGTTSGTVSNKTFSVNPALSKIFQTGGGSY